MHCILPFCREKGSAEQKSSFVTNVMNVTYCFTSIWYEPNLVTKILAQEHQVPYNKMDMKFET